MKSATPGLVLLSVLTFHATAVLAQQATVHERVTALKAGMASSQAELKAYEWVETTVISLKGEEKSRQLNRCYQGAEGNVQRIPITTPAPEERRRGLRGRIAEGRKEELTDYMKDATSLVRRYVPPDQARIQAAKDAGKVSITPLDAKRARLTFADYLKPGDSFAIDIDLGNNRPVEARVSTYLDSKEERIALDIRFGVMEGKISFPEVTVLNAEAKGLTVTVQNSGYRRTGN